MFENTTFNRLDLVIFNNFLKQIDAIEAMLKKEKASISAYYLRAERHY